MLSKICMVCRQTSFGSYAHGQWLCPYCGFDVNSMETKTSGAKAGSRIYQKSKGNSRKKQMSKEITSLLKRAAWIKRREQRG